MNNPFINYLNNKKKENQMQMLICTKYLTHKCNQRQPLSVIILCSEEFLGYTIDKDTLVMFFEYVTEYNDIRKPNILRYFMEQDNLNIFCKNKEGTIIIKPDVLEDMQSHRKQLQEEYIFNTAPEDDVASIPPQDENC